MERFGLVCVFSLRRENFNKDDFQEELRGFVMILLNKYIRKTIPIVTQNNTNSYAKQYQ